MHRITAIAALLASTVVHAEAARVDQFKWLAGCWGFDTDNGRYEEMWSAPTGNNIVGVSRRIADGFTREFEFMRIVTSGGGFDYIALPQGENEVRFNSIVADGTRAVFENPDNAFPSRISYEFVPPDALNARIEGQSNGQTMRLNFPMKRRPCP
ncbi:hypothetical protein SAMN04488120_103205 [Fontimonas thermophila]|uniref:DUF6265 domain-containing protein n=1 Tax=Fontimonas thermophila TaxID=1076937 RepID=A0A1I2IBP8_9GAMM|nr:DUF6265 family protein [Fontimonas thermophila]SFF39799.1 hypothetical protein SAMN04488120_103205 [Fontimonas thermophila]